MELSRKVNYLLAHGNYIKGVGEERVVFVNYIIQMKPSLIRLPLLDSHTSYLSRSHKFISLPASFSLFFFFFNSNRLNTRIKLQSGVTIRRMKRFAELEVLNRRGLSSLLRNSSALRPLYVVINIKNESVYIPSLSQRAFIGLYFRASVQS